MCIIIVAPSGTDKKSTFLSEAIEEGLRCNSSGGFGFAVKQPKKSVIILRKGFFNTIALNQALEEINPTTEDLLIIHGRIPTAGKTDQANTHPFILSEDVKVATQLSLDNLKRPVVFHNGGFADYRYNNCDYSDTCNITTELFAFPTVTELIKTQPKTFEKVFQGAITTNGWNKLAFMFPDMIEPILLGNFEQEKGYFFSNDGYKSYANKGFLRGLDEHVGVFCTKFKHKKNASVGRIVPLSIDRMLPPHTNNKKGKSEESPVCNNILITRANHDELTFEFKQNWGQFVKTGDIAIIHNILNEGLQPFDVVRGTMQVGITVKTSLLRSYTCYLAAANLFNMTICRPKLECAEKYSDMIKFTTRYDLNSDKELKSVIRKLSTADVNTELIKVGKKGNKTKLRVDAIIEALIQYGKGPKLPGRWNPSLNHAVIVHDEVNADENPFKESADILTASGLPTDNGSEDNPVDPGWTDKNIDTEETIAPTYGSIFGM